MTYATATQLRELRAALEAMTLGPWRVDHDGPSRPIILTHGGHPAAAMMLTIGEIDRPGRASSYSREEADCVGVSMLRTLGLTLIEEIENHRRYVAEAAHRAHRVQLASAAFDDLVPGVGQPLSAFNAEGLRRAAALLREALDAKPGDL